MKICYYINIFRYGCFQDLVRNIDTTEGGLEKFSRGYESFGLHRTPDNGIQMMEWAPGAEELFLRGDFSKPSYSLILSCLIFCSHSLVLQFWLMPVYDGFVIKI